MKRIFLTIIITAAALGANAQKKAFAKVAPLPNTSIPKEVFVSSFETNIVEGDLRLTRAFVKMAEGKDFVPVYSVSKKNDASFNGGKAMQISLNQGSYDALFSRPPLSDKRAELTKYINDNNISLNDEKGWITVIKHYNGY